LTRQKRLLGVLGAGAVVTTLTAAPGLSQTSAPTRTLYVATQRQPLQQTPFIHTRDCMRRPRSCINGVGGRELVYLTKGRLPTRATTATVLSDTNCAADGNGISHCANILRLASGRRVTVRHDHSMMNDPCLRPGERVRMTRLR
jgi:hypothetical protein